MTDRKALLFGVVTFGMWGFFPAFFHLLLPAGAVTAFDKLSQVGISEGVVSQDSAALPNRNSRAISRNNAGSMDFMATLTVRNPILITT